MQCSHCSITKTALKFISHNEIQLHLTLTHKINQVRNHMPYKLPLALILSSSVHNTTFQITQQVHFVRFITGPCSCTNKNPFVIYRLTKYPNLRRHEFPQRQSLIIIPHNLLLKSTASCRSCDISDSIPNVTKHTPKELLLTYCDLITHWWRRIRSYNGFSMAPL